MNPRKQLEAIVELARAAAVGWDAYLSTEAALAASTIPGGGAGRGNDVADPTYAIVLSHDRYNETASQVAEALGILRAVHRNMSRARGRDTDIAAALAAARCDGSVDATCTRNAVRNIEGHALCWACIKRQQRAEGAA